MSNTPAYYLFNNQELIGSMFSILRDRLNDDEFMGYFDSEICPQLLSLLDEQPVMRY